MGQCDLVPSLPHDASIRFFDCLTRFVPSSIDAVVGEPAGRLRRVQDGHYGPGRSGSSRVNATLIALVRNTEVDGMVQSMTDLEATFNRKFNYPWIFFNDEPFSDEFKAKTRAATGAEVQYGERMFFLEFQLD